MPAKWDDAAERKMLLLVIKRSDIKPEPSVFEEAAKVLGGEYNSNGCYQRFYKLKREADTLIAKSGSGDDNSTEAPSTPAAKKKTPAKPRASAKTPAKSTGRGRKRKDTDEDNIDGENSDGSDSPTKKQKVEAKEEPVVKQDSSQEEDD